jgi:hypothetical protein
METRNYLQDFMTPETNREGGEQVKAKWRIKHYKPGQIWIVAPDGSYFAETPHEIHAQTIIDALELFIQISDAAGVKGDAVTATPQIVSKFNALNKAPDETLVEKAEEKVRQLQASRDEEKKALNWIDAHGQYILDRAGFLNEKTEADLRALLTRQPK